MQQIIQSRTWNYSIKDAWHYSWGSLKYSSKKVYHILIGSNPSSPLFKWLWGSSNLGTHKFFFWLLLRDRLNTRNLLRRKNMDLQDFSCVLCSLGCEEQVITCSLSVLLVGLVGPQSLLHGVWTLVPLTWFYRQERISIGQSLEKSSSLAAGLFGPQETKLYLTMDRRMLINGKEISRLSLDWCTKAKAPGVVFLMFGEIASYSCCYLFLLDLDAL